MPSLYDAIIIGCLATLGIALSWLFEVAIIEEAVSINTLFLLAGLVVVAALVGTSVGYFIGIGLFGVPIIPAHWQWPRWAPGLDLPGLMAEWCYYLIWIAVGLWFAALT